MTHGTPENPGPAGPAAAERIHVALESALGRLRGGVRAVDPRVDELAELLSDFVLDGGKRMRPRFALAGWDATAPGDAPAPDAVVTACSALELIQACALIHDDIIDASDTRRGRPTVHRRAEAAHERAQWSDDPARYGVSQAILLGDLALAWADQMFVTSGLAPDALGRALEPWYAMKTEVLSGQMLDVLAESGETSDEETPRRVNRFKTAAYTVERPLHIGAALAGAPADTVSTLRDFGVAIGLAFQLRDDLLGVFGDPAVTGKPSGDDLREGKRTLLVARGAALAGPEAAADLLELLGTEVDDAALSRAREILVASGAVADVEAEIDALTARALAALDRAELTPRGREELVGLAGAATRRRS